MSKPTQTRTYADILKEIEDLRTQAAAVKTKEVAEVIDRIRVAISVYGITPEDIFSKARRKSTKKRSPTKTSSHVRQSAAQYADGQGNTWGGLGPRPLWLKEQLAAGRQLSEFAVSSRVKPVAKKKHKKSATRRIFTPEQRAAAIEKVEELRKNGVQWPVISRKLGIHSTVLRTWINRATTA